ncbi:MAG: hypothetical protein JHC93_07075, partial [Parachlamydiales bacterium]|nr:hypothetical protein [Parachlamydiales bacterium]
KGIELTTLASGDLIVETMSSSIKGNKELSLERLDKFLANTSFSRYCYREKEMIKRYLKELRKQIISNNYNFSLVQAKEIIAFPKILLIRAIAFEQNKCLSNFNPKVLILTHTGGGGHLSAGLSIYEILIQNYDPLLINPLETMYGDGLFNRFQKQGHYTLLKLLARGQALAEQVFCPIQVIPDLERLIDEEKPQLVISVFPVANFLTFEVCKKRNIPFVVVATDLEAQHFIKHIDRPSPNLFKFVIAFDDPALKAPFLNKLTDENIFPIGFPIRKDFVLNNPKIRTYWKKKFKIKDKDRVVLLMVGAQGSFLLTHYAKLFLQESCQSRLHVIAICAGNDECYDQLHNLKKEYRHRKMSLHLFKEVSGADVAAFMSLSHLFITKPGGASVNEALTMSLRMLFVKKAVEGMHWELGNAKYVINRGFGEFIESDEHFLEQVDQGISKGPLVLDECPSKSFHIHFQKLVSEIINH